MICFEKIRDIQNNISKDPQTEISQIHTAQNFENKNWFEQI